MTKEASINLKGIAIVLMYIHHLFYMADRMDLYNIQSFFSRETLVKMGAYGNACVTIFAFVSGYGITKKYLSSLNTKTNWIEVVVKGILRLQLSVAIVLTIALIVAEILQAHTFADIYIQEEGSTGLLNLLIDISGFASLFCVKTYNASWWYLKIAIWIMITIGKYRYSGV